MKYEKPSEEDKIYVGQRHFIATNVFGPTTSFQQNLANKLFHIQPSLACFMI